MGDFMHLVMAKFKDGVVVDEILKEIEVMNSQIDSVKRFEWGNDLDGMEMLTQGFTHAFLMTFHKKEDMDAFLGHPKHVDFAAIFSAVVEKVVLLDFPIVLVKAPK